eukprot:m.107534 g.107534  ORF g.107534 m.107534 type:complete len:88 (+) comp51702_c1_seq2:761-1024(+)
MIACAALALAFMRHSTDNTNEADPRVLAFSWYSSNYPEEAKLDTVQPRFSALVEEIGLFLSDKETTTSTSRPSGTPDHSSNETSFLC